MLYECLLGHNVLMLVSAYMHPVQIVSSSIPLEGYFQSDWNFFTYDFLCFLLIKRIVPMMIIITS